MPDTATDDAQPVDPADLTEGERVRVEQDDRDEPLTGEVTGIRTEAGRYGVTLEVTGTENPHRLKEGHVGTVTCWQFEGREFYRLDGEEPEGRA